MATEIIAPALGLSQETGRLITWHKKEGAIVAQAALNFCRHYHNILKIRCV